MQILVHVVGGCPTIRWTWSSRCSACSPMPPGSRCCGHWSTGRCRSTSWPSTSESRRRRCRSIWRSCGWRRLVRTRREGTTIFYSLENDHVAQLVTDAVFNAEHAGPGIPGHHRTTDDLRVLHRRHGLRSDPCATERIGRMTHDDPHARTDTRSRSRACTGTTMGTATGRGGRFGAARAGGVRAAQPRRRRQHRRRAGIQRRRYPRGEDQPASRSAPPPSRSW